MFSGGIQVPPASAPSPTNDRAKAFQSPLRSKRSYDLRSGPGCSFRRAAASGSAFRGRRRWPSQTGGTEAVVPRRATAVRGAMCLQPGAPQWLSGGPESGARHPPCGGASTVRQRGPGRGESAMVCSAKVCPRSPGDRSLGHIGGVHGRAGRRQRAPGGRRLLDGPIQPVRFPTAKRMPRGSLERETGFDSSSDSRV